MSAALFEGYSYPAAYGYGGLWAMIAKPWPVNVADMQCLRRQHPKHGRLHLEEAPSTGHGRVCQISPASLILP